jgi:hypothetical protein
MMLILAILTSLATIRLRTRAAAFAAAHVNSEGAAP